MLTWKSTCFYLALLSISAIIAFLIINKSGRPEREERREEATSVETVVAEKRDEPLLITAYGTVETDREMTLSAEVSGKVIYISPDFNVGVIVEKGELLVKIDPTDYQAAVWQEKANLEAIVLSLEVEKGKQNIAKKDWSKLSETIQKNFVNTDLVLRKPQLKEREVALTAAKNSLKKALKDLERTEITAPFTAIVLQCDVEVGDVISPQKSLAILSAIDKFRVEAKVPLYMLNWIDFPDKEGKGGSEVTVVQNLVNNRVEKKGRLLYYLADLDPAGRMAKIIAEIDNPLELEGEKRGRFPFLIGTYVEVKIAGRAVKNAIALPTEALRGENLLFVRDKKGRLETRRVEVYEKNRERALITAGLESGEEVVISDIALPIEGMQLIHEGEEKR